MANEATLIFETEVPLPFTIDDATGIEKGTLLSMADPMTASGSLSASGSVIAGIAAEEKIANDGRTHLGVYRKGIFKMALSGSCVVGENLINDISPNFVTRLNEVSATSGSHVVGTALETGADGETILVELNPRKTG